MKKLFLFITLFTFIFPLSCFGSGPISGGPIGTGGIDMGAPGTIGKFQLDHNTETLNADRTILITDKPIHFFDANGADRNVTLSAEASSTDLVFTIVNVSNGASEDLAIRDDTPTTLVTIGPGQGTRVSCDGTSWKIWDGGIYRDGTSNTIGHPSSPFTMQGSYIVMKSSAGQWVFSIVNNNTILNQDLGRLGIHTATPDTLVEIEEEGKDTEQTISCYHNTEATASIITLRKADNTAAAPALVDDNAVLGRINFKGYDGSGWHTGAKIEARIDGTPSDGTDMPTELAFLTTADGAGSPTDRVRIGPDGEVEIINRLVLNDNTFSFTIEADITDPLPSTVILLSGDNDSDNDVIDLQDGETAGQVLYLIASANIDADDTCTINYGDTTCTNCPATVFNKVGENAHLIWSGSTWVVISLQNAL